jgi:hypothetical protein
MLLMCRGIYIRAGAKAMGRGRHIYYSKDCIDKKQNLQKVREGTRRLVVKES